MAEHDDADLRTGAKAAAAAAAVGAAVGVARAIAARAGEAGNRDDDHDDERSEPEVEDVSETGDENEDDENEDDENEDEENEHDEPDPEPVQGASVDRLRGLTDRARGLLQELSGSDVESVSAIDRTRDGWRVTLVAVEVRRVPASTDVLATYDVELDGDGDLVRYERRSRYSRAQSDHGDGG